MNRRTDEQTHTNTKWNDLHNEDICNVIREHIDHLLNICQINEIDCQNVNMCVNKFAGKLNE